MRNKAALIAIGAVLTGLIVGVALVSCGGGDSSTTDTSAPALTIPGGSDKLGAGTTGETGPTGSTGSSGQQQQSPPQSGGTQDQQQSGGSGAPAQPDTQQHDVPPPPGSPASKFEKFCEQNPGAC